MSIYNNEKQISRRKLRRKFRKQFRKGAKKQAIEKRNRFENLLEEMIDETLSDFQDSKAINYLFYDCNFDFRLFNLSKEASVIIENGILLEEDLAYVPVDVSGIETIHEYVKEEDEKNE